MALSTSVLSPIRIISPVARFVSQGTDLCAIMGRGTVPRLDLSFHKCSFFSIISVDSMAVLPRKLAISIGIFPFFFRYGALKAAKAARMAGTSSHPAAFGWVNWIVGVL